MARKNNRYKIMEQYMSLALIIDAVLFIGYLVVAGFGITWAKVILAILAILLSCAILYFLYMTKELLRQRSFWMTAASAAIVICTLFSLILNFPRPKYQLPDPTDPVSTTLATTEAVNATPDATSTKNK